MPGMELENRKFAHIPMPRYHNCRSVLQPTPDRKQIDDSIMLAHPEVDRWVPEMGRGALPSERWFTNT